MGVPVMTMNHEATAELVGQLKLLGATRLLLHPFTVGDVLETVEGMWTPDGAPVVVPANLDELKKAVEAKAEANAKMDTALADQSDEIQAANSEDDTLTEAEANGEAPAEEAKAEPEVEAEAEAVPA
jgi:hypothetical protein